MYQTLKRLVAALKAAQVKINYLKSMSQAGREIVTPAACSPLASL